MNRVMLIPLLREHPKAKPLAMALIAAAAEQGASTEDLRIACELAQGAYREAMDNSRFPVTQFESDAKAALERIVKSVRRGREMQMGITLAVVSLVLSVISIALLRL